MSGRARRSLGYSGDYADRDYGEYDLDSDNPNTADYEYDTDHGHFGPDPRIVPALSSPTFGGQASQQGYGVPEEPLIRPDYVSQVLRPIIMTTPVQVKKF